MEKTRHSKSRYISNYNLFGEFEELPDVAHCERIETRSKLNNWEFRPHRHARLHQVLVIAKGGGRANLEGNDYAINNNKVINVPTGSVHAFEFIPGTQGWVLTVTSALVDDISLRDEAIRSALNQAALVSTTSDIKPLIKKIFAEYEARGFARAHLLHSLSAAILGLVARIIVNKVIDQPRATSPRFNLFESLVESHFQQRLSVTEYASMLAVSTTHLSRITREAVGMSAVKYITERSVREAKRMLSFTNLPIADIAYELGYQDPAHFTKNFSKLVGCSPRDFRNRIAN